MTITVNDVLQSHTGDVLNIVDTDSVRKAIGLFAVKCCRVANVMDASGEACGLISENDLASVIAEQGAAALSQTVGDVMSFDILIAAPEMPVIDAIKIMIEQKRQHMSVMDESGHLYGSVGIMEATTAYVKHTPA